ncbi:acyltransferase family protein [Oerskovia flava]|uniref:acyltransferase family protein n=1 Tax=Oerskovia flava TaxID=2986422 RepID=UPI00223FFC73|nr:acyltransferase family protein [Oerskovia sp. JB1-3-2]
MTSTDTRSAVPAGAAGGSRPGGFRPDIEGLRALAIGLVLVYHAGITFVPGGFIGVDVFFVVSGFLITGLLVREVERTGRISLSRFYARRAKRLLPASALVLTATAVLTWLTASVVEWRTIGGDIVSASLYVVNWRLADRAVDYLAEGTGASPVQHFWSLAVEEQFYIVWPLLLLVVAAIVRRRKVAVRPLMAIALTLIVVPSLVYSVIATASNPATAFFITPTRLWELGIGALVAVGASLWLRIPRPVALALGWLGFGTILVAALMLDGTTPWPSAWALVPTLATAAIIIAGAHVVGGTSRFLAWRPFVWIGGLSYSLYLWHWPLLIAATNIWGELGQKQGLLVMAASFVPAWLSYKFVENPARFSRRLSESNGLTLSFGANLTAVGAIAGIVLMFAVPSVGTAGATTTSDPDRLGANKLEREKDTASGEDTVTGIEVVDTVASLVPQPQDAVDDVPAAYSEGCQAEPAATEPVYCEFGDPDGEVTVVLTGDSKMIQWVDLFDRIGVDEGWRVLTATKSSCSFSGALGTAFDEPYVECVEHSERLMADMLEMRPDVIVTSQRHKEGADDDGTMRRGPMIDALRSTWQELEEAGIDVIALMDNPSPFGIDAAEGQVYACVADHAEELSRCAFDRDGGIERSGQPVFVEAAREVDEVDVLDLTDTLCNDSMCPPVIGDVLVYRQGSHVTNTYVATLEDVMAARLVPLVDQAVRASAGE